MLWSGALTMAIQGLEWWIRGQEHLLCMLEDLDAAVVERGRSGRFTGHSGEQTQQASSERHCLKGIKAESTQDGTSSLYPLLDCVCGGRGAHTPHSGACATHMSTNTHIYIPCSLFLTHTYIHTAHHAFTHTHMHTLHIHKHINKINIFKRQFTFAATDLSSYLLNSKNGNYHLLSLVIFQALPQNSLNLFLFVFIEFR